MPVLVSLGETDPIRRLGTGDDDLLDPQLGPRLDDVVSRLGVGPEGLVIGDEHVTSVGRKVDDGVRGLRRTRTGDLELVEVEQRGKGVEDLARFGQVDLQGVDGYRGIGEGDEIQVEDFVALGDEVGDDMFSGLAASSGQDYSRHVADCRRIGVLAREFGT